jgi:hypothetical protein
MTKIVTLLTLALAFTTPAFAADDAKSIAERVIAKWGKSTTKAMLRP